MTTHEYITEGLDLFSKPPLQLSIVSNQLLQLMPTNSIDRGNVVEFSFSAPFGRLYDLNNLFLSAIVQIVKEDGTTYSASDKTQPMYSNGILNNLIKNLSLSLQSKRIVSFSDNYGMKSYVEHLLNYSPSVSDSKLVASGLFGSDSILMSHGRNSKRLGLYGKLSVLNLNRYLISNVLCTLKFILNGSSYIIIESEDETKKKTKSKLIIHSLCLYLREVTVSETFHIYLERTLASSNPAFYTYKEGNLITYCISNNTKSVIIPNIYSVMKPFFCIFFMVETSKLSGDGTNPNIFSYNNLSTFSFLLNHQVVPGMPVEIKNTPDEENYAVCFSHLLSHIDQLKENTENYISYENYLKKCFFVSHECSGISNWTTSDIHEEMQMCQLGFSATFSEKTTKNLTACFYVLSTKQFTISAKREVTVII